MVHLLGDNWQRPAMESAMEGFDLPDGVIPIDDLFLEAEGSAWKNLPTDLINLVIDRAALRRFSEQAGIPVPRWGVGSSFEEIARKVMSWGKFPLAIKSRVNASGGRGVYRLEGFRELPTFFEKIKALHPDAPVLIEDWIEPTTATVEVTVDPRGCILISQKGLERSLAVRTAWELFPVKLSEKFGREVEKILANFSRLLEQKCILTRFTIAFAEKIGYLIALGGACNRLEYFPGWCEPVGTPPILSSLLGNVQQSILAGRGNFGRLQILRRPARQQPFPAELPVSARKLPISRYFPAGRQALALLEGKNPRALLEQAILLARLMEEAEAA